MLGYLLARGAIKAFTRRFKPSRYNGGSLLGLRGLVFKSHGGADAYGYEWAIKRAFDAAKYDVLSRISTTIAALMPQAEVLTPALAADGAAVLIEQKTA
jgi:phosphate acyltransferase